MNNYSFFQVDVFTDSAFGGNPLAVFPDAVGLTSKDMQRIALELNLSETTFVFPPETERADFKVRIFTPKKELEFAGHPLVGTHWVLAQLGKVDLQNESVKEVKFELGVGVRSGYLHIKNGEVIRVVTNHQKPEFFDTANQKQVKKLAQALGVEAETIWDTEWPVQVVSTGLKQLFVPIRSLEDISSLAVGNQEGKTMLAVCKELGVYADCIMTFCTETERDDCDLHARFFAPSLGIPEDPATGSASGGLGAYVIANEVLPSTSPTTLVTTEQGLEMNRPSKVYIEIEHNKNDINMIRVGGEVVPVIEGIIKW
jgi:trans-2,3-dihydro-3-hydroxyanthranilate isomerase